MRVHVYNAYMQCVCMYNAYNVYTAVYMQFICMYNTYV